MVEVDWPKPQNRSVSPFFRFLTVRHESVNDWLVILLTDWSLLTETGKSVSEWLSPLRHSWGRLILVLLQNRGTFSFFCYKVKALFEYRRHFFIICYEVKPLSEPLLRSQGTFYRLDHSVRYHNRAIELFRRYQLTIWFIYEISNYKRSRAIY
jgi:hypothetical protein